MNVIFLTLLLGLIYNQVHGQNDYCYGKDTEKLETRQFGTKTAYEIVKGTLYGRQYQVPNCKPVKTWLLSRHGTRFQSKKTIEQMHELEYLRDEIVKNYKVRKSQPDVGGLCVQDQFIIQSWKLNTSITPDHAELLSSQGWHDMKYLAKNYQYIFPEILLKQYSQEKFVFRHTDSERTKDSYRAFVEGLFGDGADTYINLPPVVGNDTLLKPYDSCPTWVENDKKKDDPNLEIYKFENSQLMKDTIQAISTRLGFRYALEPKQIDQMWDMCRYEQAWHVDRSSSWCAAFTPEQISVLEYQEDLKYYFKSGYGIDLNSRITCAAVKDMLQHLDSKEQPQSVSYFTHSSTVQMFLVALGINKDVESLRADNYKHLANRKWKVSLSAPFAANLMAVKYECPSDEDPNKVMFFLNQNPVDLNWCKVGLCNWRDVMNQYENFRNANCDEYFCGNSAASFSISLAALIISIVFYLF